MANNQGKKFEEQIKENILEVENITITRLKDDVGRKKGVSNICDYIVYKYPHQYFLECKSHKGASLPLTCITENQIQGIIEMSKVPGVVSGLIIWFIDKDTTIFVDGIVLEHIINSGAKSIRFDCNVYNFEGKKKRVFFNYNMKSFFDFCEKEYAYGKDDKHLLST